MPYIRKTVNLNISDSLREILEEIKDASVLAERLLKRNDKEDLQEDFVDYISISVEDQTKISYLSPEKMQLIDPSDYWTTNRRVRARPGSVIQKIFKNLLPRDVEIFNNLYKSALNRIKFTLKIVEGESIKRYYYGENYRNSDGSLGSSCMKYINRQDYLNIYVDNPSIIKMLIMVDDEGYLLGRSLLWNCNGYKIMDRIYTINDEELSYHFKKWAIDNGYMYKHEQKWNNTLSFELDGKKIEQKIEIKLPFFKYQKYPYLDTFKFLDSKKGALYNYIPNDYIKTLCSADGDLYSSDFLALDFVTNLFQNRDETVSIRYFDGKFINHELRTHSSNVEWSRLNDMYILRKDCFHNEEVDDYIFCETLDQLNDKKAIENAKIKVQEREQSRKRESDILSSSLLSINHSGNSTVSLFNRLISETFDIIE